MKSRPQQLRVRSRICVTGWLVACEAEEGSSMVLVLRCLVTRLMVDVFLCGGPIELELWCC